uniref:Ig-like domain-containing protein n=2 Tax=Eptatretus burgeri TaxID=7764 RepID=A0A8C4QLV7_EPTBU
MFPTVPVSQPRLSATEVVVAEGKEVEVDCHSQRGSPPISYFWTRVGAGVAASGWSAAGPLLHLSPVGRTDAGVLLCTAMNFASSAQSFPVKLQVLFGPDSPHIFTLKDHAMQEVTESSLTLAEGHPIRLVCRASSEPTAQLTWWPGRPGMEERIGAEKNGWLEFPKVSRHDGGHYVCSALNPVLHNRVFSTVNISVLYAPDQDPRCSVKPTNDYRHITLTCMWEGGVPEASITWVRGGETGIEQENNLGASTIGERKMASNAQVLEGKELRNWSEFTCLCLHPTAQRACRQTVFLPPGEPHCQADFSKHSASAFLSCQWPGGQPTALLQWFGQQGHQLSEAGTSPLVLSVAAAAAEKHELAGAVCRAIHPLLRHGSWDCRPTLAKRRSFPVIATTLGVLLTLSILASTLILVFHHLRKRERQQACGSAEETESELASRTPGPADSSTSSYQAKQPKPGSDLESETQRKTDSEQAADVETDWRMESVAEKSDLAVTEVEVLAEVHSSGYRFWLLYI